MTVFASRVDVTDEPTPLTIGRERDLDSGHSAALYNPGPTDVFLGPSDVDVATGFLFMAETAATVDLAKDERLYGIVASGAQAIHVLQVGV